jgi:CHAT domain-containing protein
MKWPLLLLLLLTSSLAPAQRAPQAVEDLLNGEVTDLIAQGQFEKADEIVDGIFKNDQATLAKHPLLLALAYRKKGAVLNYLGQSRKSVDYYHKAVVLWKKEKPDDSSTLVRLHYLSLLAYSWLKDVDNAKKEADAAISLNRLANAQDSSDLADVYYELGDVYLMAQNVGDAYDYLQRSIAIKQGIGRPVGQWAYSSMLYCLEGLGRYDEAVAFFNQNILPQKAHLAPDELARAYQAMGNVYKQKKDYKQAIYCNNQSISILKELVKKTDNPLYFAQASKNLENLCMVYRSMGQYAKAEQSIQAALKAYRAYYKTDYNENVADAYDHLGDVYADKGKYETALRHYHKAIQCLMPKFKGGPMDAPALGNQSVGFLGRHLSVFLASKAATLHRLAQQQPQEANRLLHAALDNYRTLDTLLVRMRQSFQGETSKFLLTENAIAAYGDAIDVAHELYQSTKQRQYFEAAFVFSERAKAVVLDEHLKNERAKAEHLPDSLAQRERDLKMQEAALEKMAYQFPDDQHIQGELLDIKLKTNRLARLLERAYPDYYKEKYGFPHTDIAAIQQRLPQGTLMVEYFWGKRSMFIFGLTKNDFYIQKKEIPDFFDAAFSDYRRAVSDWDFVRDSASFAERDYLRHGHALYEFLLFDILQNAGNGTSRLLIVPDYRLGYISFDGLLTQSHQGSWIDRDLPSLLKRYAIGYTYAARFLVANEPPHPKAKYGFGAFGLDYKGKNAAPLLGMNEARLPQTVLRDGRWQELPNAIEEIKSLSKKMNGWAWINEEATKRNFLEKGANCGILHLAMHATVDEDDPLRSKLIFGNGLSGEDDFLYANEMSGLRINASLAVLSACNTGYGSIRRGEGIMSLSRAFALAGCPSMLMSLWSVSDQSTKNIMDGFYDGLLKHRPKDEALQRAKLDFLASTSSEYAKPIYWQGFIVSGDMAAVDIPKGGVPKWLWLLLGLALAAIFWGWWMWRRD